MIRVLVKKLFGAFIFTKGERCIMATLQEVVSGLDDLKATLIAVDQGVEGLHDQIKGFIGQGITPEVADQLLAKIAEVKAESDKILTDD